ncbi:hypothetical protein EMCRGX_G005497 [Ephydatia muelleri]
MIPTSPMAMTMERSASTSLRDIGAFTQSWARVWVCGKELLVFLQVPICIFTRLRMDDMFHLIVEEEVEKIKRCFSSHVWNNSWSFRKCDY